MTFVLPWAAFVSIWVGAALGLQGEAVTLTTVRTKMANKLDNIVLKSEG